MPFTCSAMRREATRRTRRLRSLARLSRSDTRAADQGTPQLGASTRECVRCAVERRSRVPMKAPCRTRCTSRLLLWLAHVVGRLWEACPAMRAPSPLSCAELGRAALLGPTRRLFDSWRRAWLGSCGLTAEFSGRGLTCQHAGAGTTRPRPSTLWLTDRCNDLLGDTALPQHVLKQLVDDAVTLLS